MAGVDLRAEGLGIRFGERSALEDVTLAFPPGSRTLVTGPAGSGKTVLLKALAGLYPPSSGRVLWDGQAVAGLSEEEKRDRQAAFGLVFQTDALFDSASVIENVLLPLVKRRVPRDEARRRAEEALASVGLAAAAAERPERLSGGMKKRAGLARAIVARPEVLLADDPLAGLDPTTARQVAELLFAVSAGKTLVVCAADPPAELSLPRRVELEAGRLRRRDEAA